MLKQAIKTLDEQGCSVAVITQEGKTFTDNGTSVRPLYRIYLSHKDEMKGASVADKVIGRAAACILVSARVKEAFAYIVSRDALRLLQANGIDAEYSLLVDRIENRTKTNMCPMEKRIFGCDDVEECIRRIDEFIKTVKYNG